MTKKISSNDFNDNPSDKKNKITLPRRGFIVASGVAACAGMFGVSATGIATDDEFQAEFADRRVREARKAWAKGFRGRPDRTLGILSDGLEARHPDIGPWNGIRAIPDSNMGLNLVHENLEVLDEVPDDIRFFAESRHLPRKSGDRHEYSFTGPQDVIRMVASAKGDAVQSNGMKLVLETEDGDEIESNAGNRDPHMGIVARIEPGKDYVLAIENTKRSVSGTYYLKGLYYTDNSDGAIDPFVDVDPDNITANTPKVIAWYNEDYTTSNPHPEPRSGPHMGGNGTFIASIMAGSGRASTIDETTITKDVPQVVLLGDKHLVYEVEAEVGTGVFGAAFGDKIQVEIYGPEGEFLGHGHNTTAKNRTHAFHTEQTVHDTGTKTYEVHIHSRRQTHTFSAASEAPARVQRVCVGAFKKPDTTAGDRTEKDSTFFAGIAPNSGLVGLSGWRKTRNDLQHLADKFASKLNLRVLTITLGFGNDLGIAGGKLSEGSIESYKALAKAGVLTVSRTMYQQPPAARDKAPAIADESIHVAKAGPWDGVFYKDINEPAAIDEDGQGAYLKPDVTAPGSIHFSNVREWIIGASSKNRSAFRTEDEQPPIRDYKGWGEFSATQPFVAGTAGLVAQAMEEEAPAGIALPPPEEAGLSDTMRLKQTILATASETPFTAAGWHQRKPNYDFGGHDPIEGWGRVNIDAAVEAAARDLTPSCNVKRKRKPDQKNRASEVSGGGQDHLSTRTTNTVEETVGLKLPRDSRAVAGHIAGEPGVYEVTINFEEYNGEDEAKAAGPPHLDLFVYNAENPARHGTPNIVTKDQGSAGSASVKFSAGQPTVNQTEGGTYYVVAKLVNVPGAYNSFDIQAQFTLTVDHLNSS